MGPMNSANMKFKWKSAPDFVLKQMYEMVQYGLLITRFNLNYYEGDIIRPCMKQIGWEKQFKTVFLQKPASNWMKLDREYLCPLSQQKNKAVSRPLKGDSCILLYL